MNRLLSGLLLLSLSILCIQQAIAQNEPQPQKETQAGKESQPRKQQGYNKESHKDYATMKISECNQCHKGEGVALNHTADWGREHRIVASNASKNCDQCHTQAFCLDCHTGGGIDVQLSTQNYRRDYIPKSHRSDWLEIHPIKAHDNPQTCERCHTDQKFCTQCHSKFKPQDLAFASHRRQFRDIPLSSVGPNHSLFTPAQCPTCHDSGIVPAHTWSSDHAKEARRNLMACQTCHSNGDVCLTCHSARQGLRVSPHPRNWNSVKNNYKDKSNGRSCIRCHDNF